MHKYEWQSKGFKLLKSFAMSLGFKWKCGVRYTKPGHMWNWEIFFCFHRKLSQKTALSDTFFVSQKQKKPNQAYEWMIIHWLFIFNVWLKPQNYQIICYRHVSQIACGNYELWSYAPVTSSSRWFNRILLSTILIPFWEILKS